MLVSKLSVLKPLVESKDGQHLTAYLTNNQNIFHLRRQLRETINTAYEYLTPVMHPDALVRFVAPLQNAIEDTSLLMNLKGNIGIFRNENSFRILSLPISVEKTCVVATSFHVKPLLRWIQNDREFLFLGITERSASLYQGNQNSLSLVDTIIFPTTLSMTSNLGNYEELKKHRKKIKKYNETIDWLNEWLFTLTKNTKPTLFVAGQEELTTLFLNGCRYENTRPQAVWPSFNPDKSSEICAQIRSILKKEAKKDLDFTLMEFYQAEDLNLTNKNIFQIAEAAIRGQIKKLIIADGINIFGKINKKTGQVLIHTTHLDHEDDDILDDLAQEVLARGGEVIVASRDQIPKRQAILAILDRSDSELMRLNSIVPLTKIKLKGELHDTHCI